MDWLWILLLTPIITGLIAWRIKTQICAWFQVVGAVLTLTAGLAVAYQVMTGSSITAWDEFIYIDALGDC